MITCGLFFANVFQIPAPLGEYPPVLNIECVVMIVGTPGYWLTIPCAHRKSYTSGSYCSPMFKYFRPPASNKYALSIPASDPLVAVDDTGNSGDDATSHGLSASVCGPKYFR